MPGGFDRADLGRMLRLLHLLCRAARVHDAPNHAVLDQSHALAPHSLAIERRTRLQRMRHVIADVDVLAEKFAANPVI